MASARPRAHLRRADGRAGRAPRAPHDAEPRARRASARHGLHRQHRSADRRDHRDQRRRPARDTTRIAANPGVFAPKTSVTPGHVFPGSARRRGGVLVRTGQTEGFGRPPSARPRRAFPHRARPASYLRDHERSDGSMARMPDLETFSKKHDLRIPSRSPTSSSYRLQTERLRHARRRARRGPRRDEHRMAGLRVRGLKHHRGRASRQFLVQARRRRPPRLK